MGCSEKRPANSNQSRVINTVQPTKNATHGGSTGCSVASTDGGHGGKTTVLQALAPFEFYQKKKKIGVVPDGSVLSYQLRETENITGDIIVFSNMTRPPVAFPVLEQSLNTAMSYSVQLKWEAIELSFDECREINKQTRTQNLCSKGFAVRKMRPIFS